MFEALASQGGIWLSNGNVLGIDLYSYFLLYSLMGMIMQIQPTANYI